MIYLACFSLSTLFAFLANQTKQRKYFFLFSVISILLPVLLAGLRNYSVGIDTDNYLTMERFWYGAVAADSLSAYMKYYMSLGFGEPLFALLVGLVAQTTGNFSVFLLLVHTIIVACVYIGGYRLREYVNPAVVLCLFYLLFFNHSLNTARQYIAMAILFAFFADLLQKKYFRYLCVVGFCFLFHRSALFGILPIFFLGWIYIGRKDKASNKRFGVRAKGTSNRLLKRQPKEVISSKRLAGVSHAVTKRQITLFVFLLLVVSLFNPLCRILIECGLLPQKYSFYLDIGSAQYAAIDTLFLLLELLCLMLFRKSLKSVQQHFDFFFTLSGTYLILYQLSAFLVYGKRVALYLCLPNLVSLAMIPSICKDPKRRKLVTIVLFGAALAYWLYVYALRNASQTLPYEWIF